MPTVRKKPGATADASFGRVVRLLRQGRGSRAHRQPVLFLILAAIAWLALYQVPVPMSEALVSALPVQRESHLGSALQFFFYDTPKVLLLLTGIVFVMGMVNSYMSRQAWWSVPLAVVTGVPMYTNAAGIIPIVEALLAKGAALGTVLAFMMSVIALSLPEMVILRKVLKMRLIATFVGVVAMGIMLVGFVFNAAL